jgi:hypothetical protein
MVIVLATGNSIDVEEADVEPDGGIKGPALVDAQPGQLVVESLGVCIGGEVAIFAAAVGDCLADAVDKLLYGIFPAAGLDITIKVFAAAGSKRPGLRYYPARRLPGRRRR